VSADNYMHVLKRDGKYVVQNRSASAYYADEGHTVESLQAEQDACRPGKYIVDESWIIPADAEHGVVFDTLGEAVEYAYSEYSEYGVSFGFPVTKTVEERSE
jgi:hypothetical protein